MLFNTPGFVLFFAGVLAVNYLVPKRFRYVYLTLVSLLFICFFNAKALASFLPATGFLILLTFFGAFVVERTKSKAVLFSLLALIAAFLIVCKATDFGNVFLRKFFSLAGKGKDFSTMSFPAPIGLSYLTFQAISYLVDVYKGKISAQRNFLKFTLYMLFFAKLVAGPIERAEKFFKQLDFKEKFDIKNVQSGLLYMLYGFFMKMVVADRAAVFVNAVFADFSNCGGCVLFAALALYSIQIYADFAGYSLIAFGAARTLGIAISQNFYMPYFSKSVGEFWRRWHISLSSWLKDYVYIPLGGSRKGTVRTYANLMATFLVSGFWHGSSLNFVAWGALHGLYQVFGRILKPVRDRAKLALRINSEVFSWRLLQRIVTFVLVMFAWIFFRSNSLSDSLLYAKLMATKPAFWELTDGSLLKFGLDFKEWFALSAAFFFMLLVDCLREKTDLASNFLAQNSAFKWICSILFALAIIIFGVYGSGYNAADFVYFKF